MRVRLVEKTKTFPNVLGSGDMKDPCPVYDGSHWHLYGSVSSAALHQQLQGRSQIGSISHHIAKNPDGPWCLQGPAVLVGVNGNSVCAPGVIFDSSKHTFHMFVQTDYEQLGGKIEHLVSGDGELFEFADTALHSIPNSAEAGIYDSHPAEINGQKYLVYSGFPTPAHPDVFLAASATNTWNGPWQRLGKILAHEQVLHHNQHNHTDYEWGLEGMQLVQLPSGRVMLIGVCFVPDQPRFRRQRVFMAVADTVTGPYRSIGPVIDPNSEEWGTAENGHAAGMFVNGVLYLFYQSRQIQSGSWRHSLAKFEIEELYTQETAMQPAAAAATNTGTLHNSAQPASV